MRAVVEQLHTLPAHVVLRTVETAQVPHIAPDRRLVIDGLGYTDDGILPATARFGYAGGSDVPAVLAKIAERGGEAAVDIDRATYFLSTIELDQTDAPGMSAWRKRLFLATSTLTADAGDQFGLPRERTVRLGSRIPL
jgi:KUP system potassium uptake protein